MVVRVTGIVELCRVQEDEDSPVLCCAACVYVCLTSLALSSQFLRALPRPEAPCLRERNGSERSRIRGGKVIKGEMR